MGDVHETTSTLRPVDEADLDALFDLMRDPQSVQMAAFTAEDPDDRTAFDSHMAMLRSSPEIRLRAITSDGVLVGSIASFVVDGQTEVTYWVDRATWGRGIASRALASFLDDVPERPVRARVASDNAASLRVLRESRVPGSGHRGVFCAGPGGRDRRDHSATGLGAAMAAIQRIGQRYAWSGLVRDRLTERWPSLEWHTDSMNRTRLSTTVDAELLDTARSVRTGATDAALVDEALRALLVHHRSAEVDASYAAYDEHPADEPDEWGDLASWRRAAAAS